MNLWTVAHQPPLSMEFSRQNIGVGFYSLLQRLFPTQGSNLGLLHCRQLLYCLSHQESPSQTAEIIVIRLEGEVEAFSGSLFIELRMAYWRLMKFPNTKSTKSLWQQLQRIYPRKRGQFPRGLLLVQPRWSGLGAKDVTQGSSNALDSGEGKEHLWNVIRQNIFSLSFLVSVQLLIFSLPSQCLSSPFLPPPCHLFLPARLGQACPRARGWGISWIGVETGTMKVGIA